MRSILLIGIAVVGVAGCETCRQSTVNCSPRKKYTTSCPMVTPDAAASPTPTKPISLPPSIKEVRGEEAEPRQFAMAPTTSTSFSPAFIPPPAPLPATSQAPPVASQGDVLLIPRWVYVPYSPHTPNGPSKLPVNVAGPQAASPYVQTENGMTVLPAMGGSGAAANAQQMAMMEQLVQQMTQINQRMADLEAKNAVKPAAAPAFLPPPAPAAFLPPPEPTPNATPAAPGVMLPLPTPVPTIPPAM